MARFAFVLVFAAALLIAACGGDDDAKDTAGASATSSQNPPLDKAAADKVAKDALLTLNDLPSGWVASPSETPNDTKLGLTGECEQFDSDTYVPSPGELGHAEGPEYTGPEDQTLKSEVAVFEDSAAVTDGLDEFDRILNACAGQIEDGLKRLVGKEFSGRDLTGLVDKVHVSIQPMSFKTFGDDTRAWRLEFGLEAIGIQFGLTSDFVIIKKGNLGASLVFEETASGTPTRAATNRLAEEESLAQTATDKIASAGD